MSNDAALHSLLHSRFQEVFGPAHHDLYDTEQWSLVPLSGQGAINVLLNGTRMGPLVWVFDAHDKQSGARHFAVTEERHIDELIEQLQNKLMLADQSRTDAGTAPRIFRDDVLTIEQLAKRPSRPPAYAAENQALLALAEGMARNPQTILQMTVDMALELCRGESSGISILEPQGESEVFRWHATAGAFATKVGGIMPRDSLDGAVIDRNALLIFERPDLRSHAPDTIDTPVEEVILAPLHAFDQPVGTVWVMAHAADRKFDREDARLLASVAQFAGAAFQVVSALNTASAGRRQMTAARDNLVIHSHELEAVIAARTQELVETHHKLRLAERMVTMGTLSAGLGHDMGNMVLAMRSRLDMLNKGADSAREHVQAVSDCVNYLQNLASGLRLMVIDPEDKRLGPEKVSLAAWWTTAQRVLASGVTANIVVESRVPDDLPDVLINRAGLTQAAYNLVQNAVDAMKEMPGHRGCITITAELDASRANVLLSFSDNGPGMSDEVRSRCMDPLFSTKSTSTSSGLGLALVHNVMKNASGSVNIKTKLGHGSTFILRLPVAT
jgi:signal transduction histidine kinase